ncbi:MAG: hypothetical protein RIS45_99 [Planctomycetota bacterium]
MDHGEQPRILIVRLSAIGDIVVTTTLLHGLRARWPKAHIGWLVESRMASLLRGQPGPHPGIDRLHEWKRTEWSADFRRGRIDRAFAGLRALRRELHAEKYDLALDAQGLLKSSLLAALSGARERWVLRPREGAKFVAHHAVERRERVLPGDEYRDLLRALEVGDAAASARMRLEIPEKARANAAELLRAPLGDAHFAVICPFTTRPQKHWFDERWAELASGLSARGLRTVALGGPGDVARMDAIRAAAPDIVSLVGRTDLLTAGAVLGRARVTVGVDTGLTHLSMANGTPTVALFGSAYPYTRAFEGSEVLLEPLPCAPCDRKPTCGGRFDCMRALTVERVLEAVNRRLSADARAVRVHG